MGCPTFGVQFKVQTTLLNEAVLCRQTVANGSGNVVSMAPMKVFQTDTAFPEAPDGWLVLGMEHSGSRDSAYTHTFTAIPAQLAYRPERTTPRPHIDGTLPARVTAAENCTYAYIDDNDRLEKEVVPAVCPVIGFDGIEMGRGVKVVQAVGNGFDDRP